MKPESTWLRRSAFGALIGWLLITFVLLHSSPDGHPQSSARVQNCYVNDEWGYQRHALGAMLPEVDQFMLGFRVVPLLDSLFTYEQAKPLLADTRQIYEELEADPDFHQLGSVMPDAYSDILGLQFRNGHYFLYVPPNLDRSKPAPAMVFLHGSGGNFKAYTWLLSKVADERGMVLIAPTYGAGNWDARWGTQAVMAALEDAQKRISIDQTRVCLAGLSNGGLGVSRMAVSDWAARFSSLVLLSPVCDAPALASAAFTAHWKGKPILVMSGEEDDRVPIDYVKQCVITMQRTEAKVELRTYARANHFFVFSQRGKFLSELSSWIEMNHLRTERK